MLHVQASCARFMCKPSTNVGNRHPPPAAWGRTGTIDASATCTPVLLPLLPTSSPTEPSRCPASRSATLS